MVFKEKGSLQQEKGFTIQQCLMCAPSLGQENMCDQYCKIEGARLKYLKHNQDTLRAAHYSGLQDTVLGLTQNWIMCPPPWTFVPPTTKVT